MTEETTTRKAAIQAAHIPSWLKIKLLRVHNGDHSEDRGYLNIGYHLGCYHLDDFTEDVDLTALDEEEVLAHPSKILRHIFASEEHPHGDLVNLIPHNRRREFLLGILAGAQGDRDEEGWLALAG